MKSYEFKRIYHPKLGRFVYKHKGNRIVVDKLFGFLRKVVSTAASNVMGKLVKPMAKKALKSGVEHAGDKIGKKVAEKSGDLIMKKIHKGFSKSKSKPILKTQQRQLSTDEYINRLISSDKKII